MPSSLSQRSWEWIQQQPNFMTNDLVRELDISKATTRSIIDELVRKGCVKAVVTSTYPHLYEKVPNVEPSFSRNRPNPHSPKNARQKIWTALRWKQNARFTAEDITASSRQSQSNVRCYINALVRYGYIRRVRPATGGKCAIFKLLITQGHRYPQITRKGLYDPNKKQLVTLSEIKKKEAQS
jgi:predicted HTH transcriptional regulator